MFDNEDKKKHSQTRHMVKKLKSMQKKLAKYGLVNRDQNFLNKIFESDPNTIEIPDMVLIVEYICHQNISILEHFDQQAKKADVRFKTILNNQVSSFEQKMKDEQSKFEQHQKRHQHEANQLYDQIEFE